MDELLADFLVETGEHIETVQNHLVQFENNPGDPSPVAQIFRLVHTVKGTAGFLGLDRLQNIAHAAETLIGHLRGGAPPDEASVSLILTAMDRIKAVLTAIAATGSEPPESDSDIVNAIAAYLGGGTGASVADRASVPQVDRDTSSSLTAAVPAGAKSILVQSSVTETIRISVSTIERIMELVSELVSTRNQLIEMTRYRENDAVKTPVQRLSALTTDLQDAVMHARMQPMERLFAGLPRLVRELCSELGKKIDLTITGAATELDRQLLELIRDPLTHMIRNCADHGIERQAERVHAGKFETGRIHVSATHEAGQIRIEIADDGRGLDANRIREKAAEKGFETASALAQMSDDEVYRFILEPGFSTTTVVSAVSGRGVGMDVVRTNIESIGGTVSISSRPGQGTRFTLRIPLTLAIAPALIVRADGMRFALPQHAVVEAVGIGGASPYTIERLQNALLLRLRDEVISVADLRDILHLNPGDDDAERLVIVMRVGPQTFGIVVDEVADVQEIVVKPLGAIFAGLRAFCGNTILGDGAVVLILDPAGLAAALGAGKAVESAPDRRPDAKFTRTATRFILFRAGPGVAKMLPVSAVSRIATIDTSEMFQAGGRLVFDHHARLVPVVYGDTAVNVSRRSCPVIMLTIGGRSFGVCVDEVLDIVEANPAAQLPSVSGSVTGTFIVKGAPAELLDAGYLMDLAFPETKPAPAPGGKTILYVDRDRGSHDLLVPALITAGYHVTPVISMSEARAALSQGAFDAVLIEEDLRDKLDNTEAAVVSMRGGTIDSRAGTENGTSGGFQPLDKFNRRSVLDALSIRLRGYGPADETKSFMAA